MSLGFRWPAVLSLAAIAILVVAVACGPAATPTPTNIPTSGAATATPTPTRSASPTPTPPGFVKNVPRNRTLITAGWDASGQVPHPDNFNPYIALDQRDHLHYTINEMLFYTNYNTGEIIPWQGEKWQYNNDFTEITLTLRDGVKFSDGEQLTADDVVFTINMLKENSPTLLLSSSMVEWVKDVQAVDKLTVRIILNKPGPRFATEFLAQGQVGRLVIMPEHIWKGQNAKEFTFYDPAKGWPVGTGPYQVVKSSNESIFFDRRDTWWAVEVGLVDSMPAPERIIYAPPTAEALPQLYINNEVDVGKTMIKGTFEAAKAQNPSLRSWRANGPVYGAPDGCNYTIVFNNQKEPFNDPEIRWAFNHAIDRAAVADLAYEGASRKNVAPFSSYGGIQNYLAPLQDLFAKYNVDDYNIQKTADILTRKGYKKGPDGFWRKPDGSAWSLTLYTGQSDPLAPVVVEQLKLAGFDVKLETLTGTVHSDTLSTGGFDLFRWVHCGSIDDPWQTLQHFHSKYAPPLGQKTPNIRAVTRYNNPELDSLLNQMEARVPSPNDPVYADLVKKATEIYLRDLPELVISEEFHVVLFNEKYWTGWPSEQDPYVAPYVPWEGFNQIIHRLKPTQ